MPEITLPEPKAQPLLRILAEAIERGEIREGQPKTFLSYSEALKRMGHSARGRAGQQLAGQGLKELDLWTMQNEALPKIAALIVNKDTHRPSPQFAESHGHGDDPKWEEWWLKEANRAIHFDWAPFLLPADGDSGCVREDEEEPEPASYGDIIVTDPLPARIRKSQITVSQVLDWLAAGQSEGEILQRHRELNRAAIRASLAYAADRERGAVGGMASRSPAPSFATKWMGKFKLPKPDPTDPRLSHLLERYERIRE